ncbi:Flp pilus assembly pilin Flp [Phyllobacterium leguminum]|uniref:Flp pilus assembly pilin Flp n=2 Tax=Phyllobacterium leguminum TaxID=314237 RepID=A0A318T391_9HYPH|nr:Flp pilus assembly pilin Flp [Phyllobacterium leguminum]
MVLIIWFRCEPAKMTVFEIFHRDETASAAVEYGLIGALVSIAIMASLFQLAASLSLDSIATLVTGATQ